LGKGKELAVMNKKLVMRNHTIFELFHQGHSQAEIARRVGISRERVRQIFVEYGMKGTRILADTLDLSMVYERHLSGETIAQIAESLQLNYNRLWRVLRQAGYTVNPHLPRKWSLAKVQAMHADYMAGMIQIEVGQKYGIRQEEVSHLFLKYGLFTYPAKKRRKIVKEDTQDVDS